MYNYSNNRNGAVGQVCTTSFSNKFKSAFTLAEVLITLGIIGVVAAMTIPTLMNSTGNAEYSTAFKKIISVLNSATELMKIDNGGSLVGAYSSADEAIDGFCEKLNCTKKCHMAETQTNCFHGADWYMLDGRAGWQDYSTVGNAASAVLSDGMLITMWWTPSCSSGDGTLCTNATVDINGFKKPNKMGRDMFEIYINQNNIVPNGSSGTNVDYATNANNCNPSSTAGAYNGAACGGRIMQEGSMKY